MSGELTVAEQLFQLSERDEPDEEIGQKILEHRASRTDLSDEEFLSEAGKIIIYEFLNPLLQDALGLNGDEHRDKVFPVGTTLAKTADLITSNINTIYKGISENNEA